ncbi:hypothetical protein BX070DRAFT_219422 [Coemansia spiralis]|nr:hypothetical protein BX070DRAFT_219422 [Coemansia spiralis]
MKRLLHRSSKSDKKSDDGNVSPTAPKKSWTASAGLSALQQSRARSGSHPQIRHLAMESHEGPVTKATMEEIRREAGSTGSNMRINSFSFSVADIGGAAESRSSPAAAVDAPNSQLSMSLEQFNGAFTDTATTARAAAHSHVPSSTQPSAEFPPRTTSAVLMGELPPRIDTSIARAPSGRMQAVKSMSADTRGPTSAFTDDSDVSLAIGASVNDKSGFDSPVQTQQPQQQPELSPQLKSDSSITPQQTQLLQNANESSKRVISEKIKKLAHRFSNSSLKDQPDPSLPSVPQALRRRPSNTPSVSERVSLFDNPELQSGNDPRASIFGKFGMASSQDDSTHSRSPSITSNAIRTPTLPLLFEPPTQQLGNHWKDMRRPQSMVHPAGSSEYGSATYESSGNSSYSSDADGKLFSRRTTAGGAEAQSGISKHINVLDSTTDRANSRTSRNSDGSGNSSQAVYAPRNDSRSVSLISGNDGINLSDSDDGDNGDNVASALVNTNFQQDFRDMSSADHQSTIAAGVQLNLPRSPPSLGTQSVGVETGSLGYRGVRSSGPSKRRTSLRSAFTTNEEHSHGPPDSAASNASSTATSPTSTRLAKPASFRRAGAVIPVLPTAGTTATMAELQRSASTASSHRADPAHIGRNRSLSQTPAVQVPILPSITAGSKCLSVDDLRRNMDFDTITAHTESRAGDTLFSCLWRNMTSDTASHSHAYLDEILSKAINADMTPSKALNSDDSGEIQLSSSVRLAAASLMVESVLNNSNAGRVLSPPEYERCSLEVASLKSRLQSAHKRLLLETRLRDAAKNLVGLHKSSGVGVSMFKGKYSSQAQSEEYNQACEKVNQVETEIAELSAKLQPLEDSLHEHQLSVLASAIRTVISEATHVSERAQANERGLRARLELLDKEATNSQSALVSEKERMAAKHATIKQALEQQVRDLQNKNHEAIARSASKEADMLDTESPLARHSASLAVERLTGEITVLKEQKRGAEQQTRLLEVKLDEAHLKEREMQHSLDELRSQASDIAETTRIKLEVAEAEAQSQAQSINAFVSGIRDIVGPLRLLGDVHENAEKLRASISNDMSMARTPPATPTLKTESAPLKNALSIESLDEYFVNIHSNSSNDSDRSNTSTSDGWDASRVASAMALISTTVSGCSEFYPEAMKIYESYTRLQKELSTEKRLREAQGLAISQQREKLAKASYLADSADQRVKEVTETLLSEHTEEKKRWSEERQRLFDNIERLTQDVKSLKARGDVDASGSSLRPLTDAQPLVYNDNNEISAKLTSDASVGNIEPVVLETLSREAELKSRISKLENRVLALESDIALAEQQLESKIEENNALQQNLNAQSTASQQASALKAEIDTLRNTEHALRKQLSELEPLKEAYARLNRELEAVKHAKSDSHAVHHIAKEPFLGEYVRKLKDASAMLTSAETTAVESSLPDGDDMIPSRNTQAVVKQGLPRLVRCKSLPDLPSLRIQNISRDAAECMLNSSTQPSMVDAQTMTERDIGSNTAPAAATTDDDVSQMLLAYSEKLILKEDALRTREDELEAVRASAIELETILQNILPNATTFAQSTAITGKRSSFNDQLSSAVSASWSPVFSANLKPNTRNRSASFFQGFRANYLGMPGSPEMANSALAAQNNALRPSSGSIISADIPKDSSSASRQSPIAKQINGVTIRESGSNGVPHLVDGLIPLSQLAAAEVNRLKALIVDLEHRSQDAGMELEQTKDKLSRLQKYCTLRSQQEDAVQEDITHVLGQISSLRAKVVRLESEKIMRENEARKLSVRCRELENRTAEQALQLIVDRVGKQEWAKNRTIDNIKEEEQDLKSSPRFASMSTVSISHPEAGDIRAEFNELLHQIIARRDEDIERMQALVDAWRDDACRASHANELRTWNTSTRGTQTT